MIKLVNIVISDRGWILEKLAKEITDRLDYVHYDITPDKSTLIQYYITYGCWKSQVSPIEMALFTHKEDNVNASKKFISIAQRVNVAIAQSNRTAQILIDAGIKTVAVIEPGVDTKKYKPQLKIAVVGRTYHTGRKGEALVNSVMDIPHIEWFFTGEGWPNPATRISDEELPSFYRSMDYILVPAVNEGGPMSILEALASGVEVIASDVGWVGEFPHIPFTRGDAGSLRETLLRLVQQRLDRSASVKALTWDRWAAQHDEIFNSLIADLPAEAKETKQGPARTRAVRDVALVLHGAVEGKALGGPSLRVPATASALENEGIRARVLRFSTPEIRKFELVHGFNIWTPTSARGLARQTARLGKPLVFSPILLDLSDLSYWREEIPREFAEGLISNDIDARLSRLALNVQAKRECRLLPDPEGGYRDTIREISELSNAFIYLSEKERSLAESYGAAVELSRIIRNPVNSEAYGEADSGLFKSHFGIKDYVLCVGRIEHRKNQLLLAYALKDTGLPLVLVGHVTEPAYFDLVQKVPGVVIHAVGRLEPNSPMLLSAIRGARVFALPSFSEGAPLAALEAAASGVQMVLSDRSGEHEYFGDKARYCSPSDPWSIRREVIDAWESNWTKRQSSSLKRYVAEKFSWKQYARETAELYELVVERRRAGSLPKAVTRRLVEFKSTTTTGTPPPCIVFDVTTSMNYGTHRSEIVRVEHSISLALMKVAATTTRFVAWSSGGKFQEIPADVVQSGLIKSYVEATGPAARPVGDFAGGGKLVVVGSGWMQNPTYAVGLSQFARSRNLELSVLIHDLTPSLFPFWFPKGYGAGFTRNFLTVIRSADRLLVYSDSTKKDLEDFSMTHDVSIALIEKVRLASKINAPSASYGDPEIGRDEKVRAQLSGRRFALATGAIHARKNYGLLYEVWLQLRLNMGDSCPHLVIVGGISWNGEDTARSMTEDSRVNSLIHILTDVDDATLDWLYKACLFTVYPSLYEGWGLPVGESLSYGKVCIASNTSSVPEIAPELTDLLDPTNRQVWVARIQHYATSAAPRLARESEIRARYNPIDWCDTAQDLIKALSNSATQSDRALFNFGTTIRPAGLGSAAVNFLAGGWHDCESWGTWASDRNSVIEIHLATDAPSDLVFSAVVRVFGNLGVERNCAVIVEGVQVSSWTLKEGSEVLRKALVPHALIPRDKSLKITLRSDEVKQVNAVNPKSNDLRQLGIGICRFTLETAESLSTFGGVARLYQDELSPDQWLNPLDQAVRNAFHGEFQGSPAWGLMSTTGRLSVRLTSYLRYQGGHQRGSKVRLTAILRAPASVSSPSNIFLLINGAKIGTWQIISTEPTRFTVDIPNDLQKTDPFELQLMSNSITSPKAVGAGANAQNFAFSVLAIRLDSVDEIQAASSQEPRLLVGVPVRSTSPVTWQAIQAGGWYGLETGGTWSMSDLGRLLFFIHPEVGSDLVIRIEAGRLAISVENQVAITLNGETVGNLSFQKAQNGLVQATAIFPLEFNEAESPRLDLRFIPEHPSSPYRDTGTADERSLGIFLTEIQVHRLKAITPSQPLIFNVAADYELAILKGWHPIETDGLRAWRWTEGATAIAIVRLPSQTVDGLDLIIKMAVGTASEDATKTVEIFANKTSVAQRALSDHSIHTAVIRIPSELITSVAFLELTFFQPDLWRPVDHGEGEDHRLLGLQLFEIALWPSGTYVAADNQVADPNNGALEGEESLSDVLLLPMDLWDPRIGDDDTKITREGWHDFEEGTSTRWSNGKEGKITFLVNPETIVRGFVLDATVGVAIASVAEPHIVDIVVNGQEVANVTLLDHLATPIQVLVSENIAARNNPIALEFRQNAPYVPAEIGQNEDNRLLGLQLYAVQILEASEIATVSPAGNSETVVGVADFVLNIGEGNAFNARANMSVPEFPGNGEKLFSDSLETKVVIELEPLAIPCEINVGSDVSSKIMVFRNWSIGEGAFRWAGAEEAGLIVQIPNNIVEAEILFTMAISMPNATSANPGTVTIKINDASEQTYTLRDAFETEITMPISREDPEWAANTSITFTQPNPSFTPGLEGSSGGQIQGLRLHRVRFDMPSSRTVPNEVAPNADMLTEQLYPECGQ